MVAFHVPLPVVREAMSDSERRSYRYRSAPSASDQRRSVSAMICRESSTAAIPAGVRATILTRLSALLRLAPALIFAAALAGTVAAPAEAATVQAPSTVTLMIPITGTIAAGATTLTLKGQVPVLLKPPAASQAEPGPAPAPWPRSSSPRCSLGPLEVQPDTEIVLRSFHERFVAGPVIAGSPELDQGSEPFRPSGLVSLRPGWRLPAGQLRQSVTVSPGERPVPGVLPAPLQPGRKGPLSERVARPGRVAARLLHERQKFARVVQALGRRCMPGLQRRGRLMRGLQARIGGSGDG
jgi:hypothetical protein